MSTNPSSLAHRARIFAIAAAAFGISCYLASYQVGLIQSVWDPIFGSASSARVLHSALSRMLPVPDSSLGALGYLMDLVLTSIGGEERWRTMPLVVLMLGGVTAAMALVSAALVFVQAVIIGHFCALCLASAAASFVIFPLAWEEVRAAMGARTSIRP